MISDREWDEMRNAAQLRFKLLKDEIRETRQGNRKDAIQGVANAAAAEQTSTEIETEDTRARDDEISRILEADTGQ